MNRASLWLALLWGALSAAEARAAGPDSDLTARAVGRAGAVVAGGGPALVYNPADLASIDAEAEASVTFVARGATFQADGQPIQHDRAEADVLPLATVARRFGKWVLAAGGYRAIGAGWSWPDCSSPPCAVVSSSIERDVFPVAAAFRVRWLEVGASARIERIEIASAAGTSDHVAPSGSVGFVAGGPLRFGAVFDLPTDAGDASQPWKLRGGVRFVRGRVDAEIGAGWEAWSSLRLPIPLHDTGSVRAGLDVALSFLTVRAGWAWEPSAVDSAHLSRALPDLDRHRVAGGATACASGLCVDLAYAHAFESSRAGTGKEPGRYDGRIDTIAFSVRLDWQALGRAGRD